MDDGRKLENWIGSKTGYTRDLARSLSPSMRRFVCSPHRRHDALLRFYLVVR